MSARSFVHRYRRCASYDSEAGHLVHEVPGTWLHATVVIPALGGADTVVRCPLYLFQDRFEEFTRAGPAPSPSQVHFPAHEDVALKAYAETRTRYLGGVAERAAFHQIGEALPAVLVGGRVVATWSWDVRRRGVRCRFHRTDGEPPDRKAIMAAATEVAAGLRRGYDDSRVNRAGARGVPELIASATP